MKKILFIIISLLIITGCNKQEFNENDKIVNDGACCKGCLCGDTIELIKNTETAAIILFITLRYDLFLSGFIACFPKSTAHIIINIIGTTILIIVIISFASNIADKALLSSHKFKNILSPTFNYTKKE